MKTKRLKEIWKDIPGYEGVYQVSNFGRVRSLDREVEHSRHGKLRLKGALLKPDYVVGGYLQYTLHKDGLPERFKAHTLVLTTFVGICPDGMEGCHEDGNPRNNTIYNLRWDTRIKNWNDRKKHGRGTEGEKHGFSKLTSSKVIDLRNEYFEGGITQVQLAKKYGIHQSHVSRLIRLESWSHI